MKDLFLSYELSVEFKKLGFNKQCFGVYDKNGNLEEDSFVDWNSIDKFNNSSSVTSAPLYFQIFDWMREKHNINAWISCFQHNDYLFIDGTYSYFIYKDGQYIANQVDFETYKEAEIECIKQLIKLLK